jgi:hypothetical protein
MTQYVGGQRARLIHANIFNMVKQNLADQGWLDPDRDHAPIQVVPDQIPEDQEVKPNVIAVSVEDIHEQQAEMGSDLSTKSWNYYIDVYAESKSFGLHLATDIVDSLRGKISTISRPGPSVVVYDLSVQSATPVPLFDAEIDEDTLQLNRSRFYQHPYQQHWWVINFEVQDTYANDLE